MEQEFRDSEGAMAGLILMRAAVAFVVLVKYTMYQFYRYYVLTYQHRTVQKQTKKPQQ